MKRRPVSAGESAHLPLPALAILALLMAGGAFALITGVGERKSPNRPHAPIENIARNAGCRVSEFDNRDHNPPVSGRFVERERTADGSYAGRRPPSLEATIHSLYHGRVLVQYRADLPAREVRKLDRLVTSDSDRVLLFANQTGMRQPVAATSYLSVMTCPRVDARTLHALRVYRDRRRGFGQAF
jgi:hypothetical protein